MLLYYLLLLFYGLDIVTSYDIKLFAGGCTSPPEAPHYSRMKCSIVSGCSLQCVAGYSFPKSFVGSSRTIEMKCSHGLWNDRYNQLNPGEALPPCEPICLPPCLHDGICVAPNQCLCKEAFEGSFCELNKDKPCTKTPLHLPQNALASCSPYVCNITCKDNHEFPHGDKNVLLTCQDGDWVYPKIIHGNPNCQPKCRPSCQNGGICLSLNQCQCGVDFRGHRCEHAASNCKRENLDFNGESHCIGRRLTYDCTLSCPKGISFSFPPADNYSCSYETGVFTPSKAPTCIYEDGIEITRLEKQETNQFPRLVRRESLKEIGSWQNILGHSEWDRYVSLKNNLTNESTSETQDIFHGYFSIYDNNDLSWLEELPANISNEPQVESSPKDSTCLVWTHSHVRTFDGVVFSFESDSNLILLDNESTFKIYVDERQNLVFTTQSKTYNLSFSDQKVVLKSSEHEILSIPGTSSGLLAEKIGKDRIKLDLTGLGLQINWLTGGTIFIKANSNLWNGTKGLCGNNNGDVLDDFMTPQGKLASSVMKLAESWRNDGRHGDYELRDQPLSFKHPCSSDTQKLEATEFCNKMLIEPRLKPCHKIFNSYSFYQTCKWDYCSGDEKQACKSMELFVSWCLAAGKKLLNQGWRSPNFCPYDCEPGLEYRLCGQGESQTCDDSLGVKRNDSVSVSVSEIDERDSDDICIEGCYCPTGTYLHEGQCITRDLCPCTFNGIKFKSGKIVKQDCNECICKSGLWHCSEEACGKRCSIVGNNHVTTFDGKPYTFMGQGRYTLLRNNDVVVQIQNIPCSPSSEIFGYRPVALPVKPEFREVIIFAYGNKILCKKGFIVLVNGLEINSIPHLVTIVNSFHIVLSQVSSLFIRVSLPDGLNILWDGENRLYLDAPSDMSDLLTGLCGNFNRVQRDDFATPEGEIEITPNAFANSWKDTECKEDTDLSQKDNCELSESLQYQTLAFCDILKSDLFKECHWAISPHPYIKNCVLDVCYCEKSSWGSCACSVLSHYATMCAAKGIIIKNWRQHINQCHLECEADQQYSVCQSGCSRSCIDISMNPKCSTLNNCIDGCSCSEGMTLNNIGKCIPINECPCIHPSLDKSLRAGSIIYQAENIGTEHCECSHGKWNCREIKNTKEKKELITQARLTCSTQKHQILDPCPRFERPTCTNMHEISVTASTTTTTATAATGNTCLPSRCVCQEGYVTLFANSSICIKKDQCPCHHAGRSYMDGERIKQDCNTCQCKGGKWFCTLRVCPSICTAWGDSHYKTFDGKIYDYHGSCEYILAQGGSGSDSFVIKIQNVPCGASDVICSKTINLKIGSTNVEKIILSRGKPLAQNGEFQRIVVRNAGLFTFVDVYDLGLTIQWDGANRVYVRVKPTWKGQIEGLCGNANDDEEDDFRRPSGMIESSQLVFGDSWKVHKYCPDGVEQQNTCDLNPKRRIWANEKCGVLKSSVFIACHSSVDLEPWYERCVLDACGCNVGGDCECLCTAIAAYAHECSAVGVPIRWRKQELCPMQCAHRSNYESCISTCPPKTCSNLFYYKAISLTCGEESCVEGCEPEPCSTFGEIYQGTEDYFCLSSRNCPRIECILENGVQYYEGDVMDSDFCQNCTCSRAQKRCRYSESKVCEENFEGSSSSYKVPLKMTSPTILVNSDNTTILECVDGWSSWINEYSPSPENPTDIESLFDFFNATKDHFVGYCSPIDMVDIECRNVLTKEPHSFPSQQYKVTCNLQEGLHCSPLLSKAYCDDFEYRVKCLCKITDTNVTVTSCSPKDLPRPLKGNCQLFEVCVNGPIGTLPRYVKKSCGTGLYYNPNSGSCDLIKNVIQFRQDCEDTKKIIIKPVLTTTTTTTVGPSIQLTPRPSNITLLCGLNSSIINIPHEIDCSLFYHCYSDDTRGVKTAELKSCGPGTLFNDISQICDFPANVYVYREECRISETTTKQVNVLLSEPSKCSKNNIYSILDNPEKRVPDSAFIASSYSKYGRPEYSRLAYIYNDELLGGLPTFRISSLSIKNIKKLNEAQGGTFELTICASMGCCETGSIDNTETNWNTEYRTQIFELGSCDNYDISLDDDEIEVQVKYSGKLRSHIDELNIRGSDGNYFSCLINKIFINNDSRVYACSKQGKGGNESLPNKGCWSPAGNNKNQYLQIQFNDSETLYGVLLRGNNKGDYVKTYHVMYSSNGVSFIYIRDEFGNNKLFTGPSNASSPSSQYFQNPITTKTVRIIPQSWSGDICIKVDFFGCLEKLNITPSSIPLLKCTDPMGISNGILSPSQISVSSVLNSDKRNFGKDKLSLSSDLAWIPALNDDNQYVIIDLTDDRKLSGLLSKGYNDSWVATLSIDYSSSGHQWTPLVDSNGNSVIFKANEDSDQVQNIVFDHMIKTRYIKIKINSWPPTGIAFKFELIGCFEPYILSTPFVTATTATSTTSSLLNCLPCPNLPEEDLRLCTRPCGSDHLWNGTACVKEFLCPCFDGHIEYQHGIIFTSQSCEDCICLPGGSIQCHAISCPLCTQPNEYTILTPNCGCLCKKCPEGNVICPTSQHCIPEEDWCNGIQDCADDEINCDHYILDSLPCPADPICPSGTVLKQTEIEHPIGCPFSKCTCAPPSCPPNHKVKYSNEGKATLDSLSQLTTLDPYLTIPECPQYNCIPQTILIICSLKGNEMKTFDGFHYNLPICHHILARHKADNWIISIHLDCDSSFTICKKNVEILQDHNRVILYQDLTVNYNGILYTAHQGTKLKNGFQLRLIGDTTFMFISLKYSFVLRWTKFGNIDITMNDGSFNQVLGLCGSPNNNSNDDKILPNGLLASSTQEFISSWIVKNSSICKGIDSCSSDQIGLAKDICNSLKFYPFNQCSTILNSRNVTKDCMTKSCQCLSETINDIRTCRCQIQSDYVTECLSANSEIDLHNWRVDHLCPAECPRGKVMKDCHKTGCQPSCNDLTNVCQEESPESKFCFPGCYCSEGNVLSEDGTSCVPKEKCQNCVCVGHGHSRYSSYDKKDFIFPGNCSYVATKHTNGDFSVLISNDVCENDFSSYCTVSLTIVTSDQKLRIDRNKKSSEKVTLHLNDTEAASSVNHVSNWFKSTLTPSANVVIQVPKFNLEVIFKSADGAFTIKFSSFIYGNKMSGLCGNCNGNSSDDFIKQDFTLAKTSNEFGNNWATTSCVAPEQKSFKCLNVSGMKKCQRLKNPSFHPCHPLISPDSFITQCEAAYCKQGNYSICVAMEEYSAACLAEANMCLEWRNPENCSSSLLCDETSVYKECSTLCDKTCENVVDELSDLSIYARMDRPSNCLLLESEGCYCPLDHVRSQEGKCIPSYQCITCLDKYKKVHYLNESWSHEPCESCNCTETGTNCDTIQCSSISCQLGEEKQIQRLKNECCPLQTCVKVPKNCSESLPPKCSKNYKLKTLTINDEDCPRFVCECIESTECPPLVQINTTLLSDGETVILKNDGCCLENKVVCNSTSCPQFLTPCPKFSREERTKGKCCYQRFCHPPKGCVDSSGQFLRHVNETWKEDPCVTCVCQYDFRHNYLINCSKVNCEYSQYNKDKENYRIQNTNTSEDCCVQWKRTGCIHKNRVFLKNETVIDIDRGQCQVYKCTPSEDERSLRKILISTQICNKNCLPGYIYQERSATECCGRCIPHECISNGKRYKLNSTTIEGCKSISCFNLNGSLILSETIKACPSIKNCPNEYRIYDSTSCCQVCTSNMVFLQECLPVPSNDTIGLIEENIRNFGSCRNEYSIDGYQQCEGRCESKTVYESALNSIGSRCFCCQATELTTLYVPLYCTSGHQITREISVPKTCACVSCSSEITIQSASLKIKPKASLEENTDRVVAQDSESYSKSTTTTTTLHSREVSRQIEVQMTSTNSKESTTNSMKGASVRIEVSSSSNPLPTYKAKKILVTPSGPSESILNISKIKKVPAVSSTSSPPPSPTTTGSTEKVTLSSFDIRNSFVSVDKIVKESLVTKSMDESYSSLSNLSPNNKYSKISTKDENEYDIDEIFNTNPASDYQYKDFESEN